MNRQQLEYNQDDSWVWLRAQHEDVESIVAIAQQYYQQDIDSILTPNPTRLAYHLHRAIVNQTFHGDQEFVTVAKDKTSGRILAWAWLERGKYTPYANEEMAVAEFLHTQLDLPLRTRIRLSGQIFDSWIYWCQANAIPVLCSTSIRDDQKGFMRLHDVYDFKRKGSFAYLRTTN